MLCYTEITVYSSESQSHSQKWQCEMEYLDSFLASTQMSALSRVELEG
jgi:hypothetical protein